MEGLIPLTLFLFTWSCASAHEHPHRPKTGVSQSGVKIPIAKLVPDAVFEVPGAPDWIAVDEDVWISNSATNSVARLNPKTNTVAATIAVGTDPCSGLAVGFGSLWVPLCGEHRLARVDLATGQVTAKLEIGIADSEGGLAIGANSIWMMTDAKGTLARIDPAKNTVVAEIHVAPGSYTVAFGAGSVWITSTEKNVLTRVDPLTNSIVATIAVGSSPRFLAVGEGAVWTLNQGDGSITRVDIATNKSVATIEVGIPGGGGDIAVGEGSVWATSWEFPIARIDPKTNTVVQQFVGPGGDAIRVGLGSVWLSNLKQHTVWRIDPRKIEAARSDAALPSTR